MIIFTKPSHGSPNQKKLIINQPEQTEKPMKDVAKLLKILPPTFRTTTPSSPSTVKEHYPRTVSLVKNLVSPLPEEYRFLTEVLLSVLLSGKFLKRFLTKRSSWRMVNRLPQYSSRCQQIMWYLYFRCD